MSSILPLSREILQQRGGGARLCSAAKPSGSAQRPGAAAPYILVQSDSARFVDSAPLPPSICFADDAAQTAHVSTIEEGHRFDDRLRRHRQLRDRRRARPIRHSS